MFDLLPVRLHLVLVGDVAQDEQASDHLGIVADDRKRRLVDRGVWAC